MTPRFELTAPAERDLEDIFFEVKERCDARRVTYRMIQWATGSLRRELAG